MKPSTKNEGNPAEKFLPDGTLHNGPEIEMYILWIWKKVFFIPMKYYGQKHQQAEEKKNIYEGLSRECLQKIFWQQWVMTTYKALNQEKIMVQFLK